LGTATRDRVDGALRRNCARNAGANALMSPHAANPSAIDTVAYARFDHAAARELPIDVTLVSRVADGKPICKRCVRPSISSRMRKRGRSWNQVEVHVVAQRGVRVAVPPRERDDTAEHDRDGGRHSPWRHHAAAPKPNREVERALRRADLYTRHARGPLGGMD